MRLLGYPAEKIAILTTYNGQRALIGDVLQQHLTVTSVVQSGTDVSAAHCIIHYIHQALVAVALIERAKAVACNEHAYSSIRYKL
eukprot:17864-Heterococcus_DN1.PRE.2